MGKKYKENGVWVWTQKAEDFAKERGLEERKAGTPAYIGYSPLGQYAPHKWVELGYVK
jgi:hypothetical protein